MGKRKRMQPDAGDVKHAKPTLSILVPGSVIDNAQSHELGTAVAGQIARSAAIFKVDEIVVLDDSPGRGLGRGAAFLARILQYLETPQYLRKALIPLHEDLRLAGMLPPLDPPHHMRASEWCSYREGVVTKSAAGKGSIIDIGLEIPGYVKEAVRPGVRVTLKLGPKDSPESKCKVAMDGGALAYSASLVDSSEPGIVEGLYWGYQTRIASSMEEVKAGSLYEEGYDLLVGTSEHGTRSASAALKLPTHKHLLLAFGGPLGLENAFAQDESTKEVPAKYFDMYINTCAEQGSRTIRTEEAILISLAYLQPALTSHDVIH